MAQTAAATVADAALSPTQKLLSLLHRYASAWRNSARVSLAGISNEK